jgi:CHAT domain-containing protein/tetratricopeptide (TPR) repeat protein
MVIMLLAALSLGVPAYTASQQQSNSQASESLTLARKTFDECQSIYRSGTPDAIPRALVKALDSVELFAKAGAKDGQAIALTWVGYLYGELGNRPQAIDAYVKAVSVFRELGDGKNEADALTSLGYAYALVDKQDDGLSALNRALELYRKLGDKIGEAKTLGTIALAYEHVGNAPTALSYYDQAISQSHAVGDTRGEATVQFLSAELLWKNKDSGKAIERFQQAIISYRALNDKKWEAVTRVTIGRVYDSDGNLQKALENYLQALPLVHESADSETESGFLKRIAEVYEKLGDSAKASEFYARSASVRENKSAESSLSPSSGPASSSSNKNGASSPGSATKSISSGLEDSKEKLQRARRLLLQGIALYKQGNEESFRQALEMASEAGQLFHDAGDRSGEAFVLHGVGYIYIVLGETTKALDYFQQALRLRRDAADKRGEAITDTNIGIIYGMLGDSAKELNYHEQSLNLYRSVGEKSGEAAALSSVGIVLEGRGEPEKGLDYYQKALALYKELNDKTGEAYALTLIGGTFKSLGDKTKALDYFQRSLSLLRSITPASTRSEDDNLLGENYAALSEAQRALEYFKLSFALGSVVEDKQSEAGVLNNIGRIYLETGEYGKSLQHHQDALALYRKLGDKNGIAVTLDFIGSVYSAWGEAAKAIDFGNQALSMFREAEDKSGEAMELNNLAVSYNSTRQNEKAFEYYQQALLLNRRLEQKRNIATTLSNLMWLLSERSTSEAIYYGKQAVNTLQDLRSNIRNTDKNLQRSFLTSIEASYRFLADLLIKQGRLPEAQQVVDLLKEQEYFDFVRRDAGDGSSLNGKASLTPEEAALEKRYHEIADRLTALATERAELFNKPNRTPDEEKRLAQIDKDIIDGNKVFQQFLNQLTQELTRPKQAARIEQIEESEGLMDTLRRLGPGTVALYTLVSDDKYRVILVTPDVRKSYEYSIKSADLNRKVLALREVLQTPSRDPRPLAREMYDILIGADLARDLAQAKAQTLMWSLDGVLRYVPMSALFDGQHYLIESYRNVVFTPASHSRLNNPVSSIWRALGLGVSKPKEGFVGLAGVPEELKGIIRDDATKSSTGVLPGKLMMDEAFTELSMETALHQSYAVVHIASHFRFQPGNETQSFLLLGDGTHLTLADLKNMGQLFSGVDLLTLSACNTAVGDRLGDGKEVESFGVIAQKKGASAVMASLWPVMDQSTQLFMREFYRLHSDKPGITKGDALREAQLALLRGQIHGTASTATMSNSDRGDLGLTGQPAFTPDPKAPFAHPYFWAPFILIGNWK